MSDRKKKHTERHFSKKVFNRLTEDGETFGSFHDVFAHFRSYDPSRTGAYTTWLIKTYCEAGFLFEDLGKAKETLQWFDEVKRRLPVERRNIADYPTLAEVWKEVKPFVETPEEMEPTKREQRRKEQEEVYAETIFLEETDDFRAVIPLTERASKWWGRGTRWCTAAEEDNQFMSYHIRAPLIIFDFKDGRKWQMHVGPLNMKIKGYFDHTIILYDESDSSVLKEIDKKTFLLLENYFDYAFAKKADVGSVINSEICNKKYDNQFTNKKFMIEIKNQNKEEKKDLLKIKAVESISLMDSVITSRNTTYQTENNIIKSKNNNPTKVDKVIYNLWIKTVSENGSEIRNVPIGIIDDNMLKKAFENDENSIAFFPKELLNERLLVSFIAKKPSCFKFLDKNLINSKLCEFSVEMDANLIRYIPLKFQSKSMISRLMKTRPDLMIYMDISLISYEDCQEALLKCPEMFLSLTEKKESGKTIWRNIPWITNKIGKELTKIAVSHNPWNIRYVPDEIKNDEICKLAYELEPDVFRHLPHQFMNMDMCEKAVLNSPNILKFIPENLMSQKLCQQAFDLDQNSAVFIPKKFRTKEMYIKPILKDSYIMDMIPQSEKIKLKNQKEYAIESNKHKL